MTKSTIVATSRRFFKDLMFQKWQLLAVIAFLTIATGCSLAAPMLIGSAIDHISTGVANAVAAKTTFVISIHTMGTVALVLLAVYLLSALFNYFSQSILASVAQKMTLMLRKRISSKLNRLPLEFYDQHQTGDILSRVTSDLEKIADTLQEGLVQLFTATITIIGAFALMFMISPMLTLIALFSIFTSIIIATIVSEKTNRYYAANQKALGQLNANIEEAFTGNQVVMAFNLQNKMVSTNDRLNEKLAQTSAKAEFATYAINPLIRFVGTLGYIVIAIRGAFSVISGTITIGDIQALFQYVNQVSEPVTELAYTLNALQGAVASAERVYEIEDSLEELPDDQTVPKLTQIRGHVNFEHVHFGYDPDLPLMQDININVKAGSKVAVVGPTGAGKTTLINLMMRFYELQGGKITIDDVDIKTMKRSDLRSLFGMVLQDTWLFNGTVADNISYGRPDATIEQIQDAAKAARIAHMIDTLPEGRI